MVLDLPATAMDDPTPLLPPSQYEVGIVHHTGMCRLDVQSSDTIDRQMG